MRVSSAKRRWDTKTRSSLLAPTEKPEIKPPFTATAIIQLKASITITKRRGREVPLSQTPRAIEEPLGRTINQDRELNCRYAISNQLLPLLPKTTSP
jgi:hypothetical protein